MSRRLPVYVLIDSSGSMAGERIQAVRVGLETLRDALCEDPHATANAAISVISFDRDAKVLTPLTGLYDFEVPEIVPPTTSPTNLGKGLKLLLEQYEKEVITGSSTQKGDWYPNLVIMTDGYPTDQADFKAAAQKIELCPPGVKSMPNKYSFGSILICAAGPEAQPDKLRDLGGQIIPLQHLNNESFQEFINYVSMSVKIASSGLSVALQSPPPGLDFIL